MDGEEAICTQVSKFCVGWGSVCCVHSIKAYSANNDHQCTHPTYTLLVSKVAMKAVILSGTPRSRTGITEYLSVSNEVDRPCVKADQVICIINPFDDDVEGGY